MRIGVAVCLVLLLMISFISQTQDHINDQVLQPSDLFSTGIRLPRSLEAVEDPKLQNVVLMKQTGYGGEEEFQSCRNGHCSGNSRKLVTAVKPTDTTASHYSKTEKSIGKKPNATPASNHNDEKDGKHAKSITDSQAAEQHDGIHDQYSEAIEITEMDYSPARRKPPIHN